MAKFYKSQAAIDTERVLKRIERASVKAVSAVSSRVTRDGELEAYDGIESAREIREMFTKIFADFSRSATFRRLAAKKSG